MDLVDSARIIASPKNAGLVCSGWFAGTSSLASLTVAKKTKDCDSRVPRRDPTARFWST
jgi:hypothetical protein